MVRSYEMMVIIDPTVEDHSVEVKAIEELVVKLGGEVAKTDVWGKRRLAYEIKKLTVIEFEIEPDQLKALGRVLSLRPLVVRHLNVAADGK